MVPPSDALAASRPPTIPAAHRRCPARPAVRYFPHARHQHARAHVRRAQSEVPRGRRPSVHRHAESRRAGGARHALHVGVHDLPDLRAGARGVRGRPLRARDRLLGQRRRLRRRDPELAPRAARRRPSRRLDRQAAFPRPAGRRPRLLRGDRADAHRRRHRRRQGPGPREHSEAQGRRQDGEARRPRRVAVHRLRPRHRGARADLAARGSAEVARPAVGAVRVVRVPAFSAHGAAAVVLPLLAAGPADAQAVRARTRARIIRSSTTTRTRSTTIRTSRPRPTSSGRSPGYAGLVSAMDENVGYVLRALRDAGLERRTRA